MSVARATGEAGEMGLREWTSGSFLELSSWFEMAAWFGMVVMVWRLPWLGGRHGPEWSWIGMVMISLFWEK
jgi:hypothetical protein